MKRNKILRVFLTLTLVAVMCLGTMTTAFAAGDPITAGENDTALTAAITKILQMPEGTTTPAATFTFTITPKTVDGVAYAYNATDGGNMPLLGTAAANNLSGTVSTRAFAATDVGTTSTDGLKSVPLETGNILASITWPHAGVYVYTITENANTYTLDTTKETMTYSGGEYDITVYVANKTDGSGLYVAAIAAEVETPDNSGQTAGDKVDPTPGGNTEGGTTGSGTDGKGDPAQGEYDYSQLIFTNTYTKTNGKTTEPDDPTPPPVVPGDVDKVLSISKTVAGMYGDQSKYFAFDLTLTKAATFTTEQTYYAYVVNASGTVVTSEANYATLSTNSNGKYIKVTTGTAITINLKHGEKLVFMNAPVGTSYVVTETAVTDYTPVITLTVDGSSTDLSSGVATTAKQLIGESANSAAFTNTYKTVTPTGISLDNLPFIMMLVLAAGAFETFVVVKSRKRVRTSEN